MAWPSATIALSRTAFAPASFTPNSRPASGGLRCWTPSRLTATSRSWTRRRRRHTLVSMASPRASRTSAHSVAWRTRSSSIRPLRWLSGPRAPSASGGLPTNLRTSFTASPTAASLPLRTSASSKPNTPELGPLGERVPSPPKLAPSSAKAHRHKDGDVCGARWHGGSRRNLCVVRGARGMCVWVSGGARSHLSVLACTRHMTRAAAQSSSKLQTATCGLTER
mmetsp:Transcript_29939/g.95417  ORF Transcript_29939/g.95417 Transcript_29939/m.95417 type:complete len:223 (-) Transcript_29939:954-1622(-)